MTWPPGMAIAGWRARWAFLWRVSRARGGRLTRVTCQPCGSTALRSLPHVRRLGGGEMCLWKMGFARRGVAVMFYLSAWQPTFRLCHGDATTAQLSDGSRVGATA